MDTTTEGEVYDVQLNTSAFDMMSQPHNESNDKIYTETTNPRLINGIIVLLLLLLNLMGNSVVFGVYHFFARPNVFSLFVKVLAVLDLVTALTTMTMDAMVKLRPLDENVLNLEVICKLTHFQVYASSVASACVLILIAYQRYRKICQPLKPSLTLQTAKKILMITTVSSFVLSLGYVVIKGPTQITIEMNHGYLATVDICRYDSNYKGTLLQFAVSGILTAAFIITLVLIIVFHVLINRALTKFEHRSSCIDPNTPTSPQSPQQDMESLKDIDEQTPPQFPVVNMEERQPRYLAQSRKSRAFSVFSTGGGPDSVSGQMYKTFLIITVVFIVSYLPHLVVLILNKVLKLDSRVLTYMQCVLLNIGYNCPYISTVSNPLIYGFRSAEFRENCKKLFKCKCRRRRSRSYPYF